METVAIVSSFAGILALVGQSLHGIVKLTDFFKDVSSASQKTVDILRELEDLRNVMLQIEQFIALVEQAPDESTRFVDCSILKEHTQKCSNDIDAWAKFTVKVDPGTEKGMAAFFRKAKVVAGKKGSEEFSKKIACHQQRIGITLSALGRTFDWLGIEQIASLCRKFDSLSSVRDQLSAQISDQITEQSSRLERAALDREEGFDLYLEKQLGPLEKRVSDSFDKQSNRLRRNHSASQSSMISIARSVSSLASQISLLMDRSQEATFPPLKPASRMEWCCDGISGIDDAFEDNTDYETCRYCLGNFWRDGSEDAHQRGRHLTEGHSFGGCNLSISYDTWDELQEHLVTFHEMNPDNSLMEERVFRRKRPKNLFRDEMFSSDHPTVKKNRLCTLKLLLQSKLQCIAWDAIENGGISRKHEIQIACIEEELMVTCGQEFKETPSYNGKGAIDAWLENEAKKGVVFDQSVTATDSKRNMINCWLLNNLRFSGTAQVQLKNGMVVPNIRDDLIIWPHDILEHWEKDRAARGVEETYPNSDGAIDSRDSLHVRGRSGGRPEPLSSAAQVSCTKVENRFLGEETKLPSRLLSGYYKLNNYESWVL